MDEQQVPKVVNIVRDRLQAISHERDIALKLEERDYRLEDEWLYLVVTPTQPGIRASDYAEVMAGIEKELSKQHIHNVMLVPAIEE